MRGGKREGAGRHKNENSNVTMFFLRVSKTLKEKISVLTTDEARKALESASEKKIKKVKKVT